MLHGIDVAASVTSLGLFLRSDTVQPGDVQPAVPAGRS